MQIAAPQFTTMNDGSRVLRFCNALLRKDEQNLSPGMTRIGIGILSKDGNRQEYLTTFSLGRTREDIEFKLKPV